MKVQVRFKVYLDIDFREQVWSEPRWVGVDSLKNLTFKDSVVPQEYAPVLTLDDVYLVHEIAGKYEEFIIWKTVLSD